MMTYDKLMKYKPANPKHMLFAMDYVKTLDPVKSYRKVYGENMDYESARVSSSRILSREDVDKFLSAYILLGISNVKGAIDPVKIALSYIDIMNDSSVNPSTRIMAADRLADGIGILGRGRLLAGLEDMEDYYIDRLGEADGGSSGEPKESVESGGELKDDE